MFLNTQYCKLDVIIEVRYLELAEVVTVFLATQAESAGLLFVCNPANHRTFTSITSPCLPPQTAQNNLSLSSHYSVISSNSVTLLHGGAGAALKQDRMRKTRCDRKEGFTKDRKHRDMSEGKDGELAKRNRDGVAYRMM